MSSANIGDMATWAAAFVALLALLVAIAERRGADRANLENRELARQNADLLKQQHRLEQRAWTDTHFDAVRDWSQQVCFTVADAMHVKEEQRGAVLSKLSALIDIGRWYFPNQWSEKYGIDKEPAYRGLRQPVLDCLVAAYDGLSDRTPNAELRSQLEACQRHFVSQIQLVIDPRRREKQIARILDDWEQSERLRDLPANNEKAGTKPNSKKVGNQ
ncbi:hypothetical protein FJ930_05370 [Mesorhizobium sp. B2-4-15]|uniref:hypothetical protein n=1 Tax=Mesorhizobium sp. B2-4-15 TaxID=2589934 RepID=UPI0011503B53|nr:hypothetical protein [Mesorhizobium sp. B2-4-15]TPK75522.1 hypothetical protein FJ930_05370 [Mesorhizobium sp. B2-4-15]